ncbi:MAG: ABC transporter permease [Candidatus Rokubacteria bacterium]|nr:ABC transporter permease [Candidatus Rokubacteria bacterium]
MVTLRLGWRNLWRNPGRSLLSIAAVAVACAVLITVESLREGLVRQTLENGTRLVIGHLQVQDATFRRDRNLYDTIGGPGGTDVRALLVAVERRVRMAAAPRVVGFGLLSADRRSAGAEILGVDPAREARVTRVLESVVDGRGLDGAPPRAVLLGKALAEELAVAVGDEVAVVTQAADGSVGNELWRVRGIIRTGLGTLDRSLAVVALHDLQDIMALGPGRIHQVVARVADPEQARRVAEVLEADGTLPPGARAESWETLVPALVDYRRLIRAWGWVMLGIVGLFAGFGVLNTMLMAVFERTHELGVLASLGLRPPLVLAMVLAECASLAAAGIAAGVALGTGGMAYFVVHGWDLTRWAEGLTLSGVLIDPVLRGAWTWRQVPSIALSLAALVTLAGLLPALRAARLRPVAALAARAD